MKPPNSSRHSTVEAMRFPLNERWLDSARDAAGGPEPFLGKIRLQIARRSSASSIAQRKYLDHIGGRGLWDAANKKTDDWTMRRRALLRFLTILHPDIEINCSRRPWSLG